MNYKDLANLSGHKLFKKINRRNHCTWPMWTI